MNKFYTTFTSLFLVVMTAFGQRYLTPEEGHKVAYFSPDSGTVQTFDVNESFFYFNNGDTIFQVDPLVVGISMKYGLPADDKVSEYPSFLNISPDGNLLWAGYTDLANADARIYSIDVASGLWEMKARMPANWDMAFWNDSILVSGLNSADFNAPSAIFILDTSGRDQHRKIIETGGSSAGIAVDSRGNLYYGTSSFTDPNALYRWDSASLAAVIESPVAAPLQLGDAEKLADLPMGVYDCEVDVGGNVFFTMNVWGGTQVLARWNGTTGMGSNFDTIAVSSQWLGMVKSRGIYSVPVIGNSLFTVGYKQALADLHTGDYPPVLNGPVPVITGHESEVLDPIDLTQFVTDLDDPDGLAFKIVVMSDQSVADLSINNDTLSGTFGLAGQANLVIEATSGGKTVTGQTVVGTWPKKEGNFLLTDFEDLTLEPESYWDGTDEPGGYQSGPSQFNNTNPGGYWSGWAYSNTSDITTPGYLNQYSAITGEGFMEEGNSGGIYGITSLYGPSVISFVENKSHAVEGFFVTNSTYATLSMEQGDWAAKKFGGLDGSDPDYFKLAVWGRAGNVSTDTIEYYLADFRFDESEKDYIIKTWQWVDLSTLGKVDSLQFGLSSSDIGEYGMNTPAYFCLDNLCVIPDEAPVVVNPLDDLYAFISKPDTIIDVSNVFSDPDDDDGSIIKSIQANNNEALVDAQIIGNELHLSFAHAIGEAQIIIEGSSRGLSAVDTLQVFVESGLGLKDKAPQVLEVYPNPGKGIFRIRSNTGNVLDVKVYTITGSVIYENEQYISGQTIDISSQAAGSYLVKILDDQQVISKLVYKQ